MNIRQVENLRPRKRRIFRRKTHLIYESIDSAELKDFFKAQVIEDKIGIATHEAYGKGYYILTECGNQCFSIIDDPMTRDGVMCPRCGRKILVNISTYLAEIAWQNMLFERCYSAFIFDMR